MHKCNNLEIKKYQNNTQTQIQFLTGFDGLIKLYMFVSDPTQNR